jgi:hypothetical protein
VSGDSVLSGSSYAYQAKEATLGQDINGDGAVGLKSTLVESAGLVKLYRFADTYALNGISTLLKFNGVPVTVDTFAGWSAIGAEVTGSGFLVAWKFANTDQFKVWTVDFNGNYVSGNVAVSGFSVAFESQETVFQQDLNGDGTIGVATTVVENVGATALTRIVDTYELRSGGSGPTLKYAGAAVTDGQFSGWTPVGAEKVGSTYQVVWKHAGTDEYKVWQTDANGNYVSGDVVLGGSTYAFQSTEYAMGGQDINGDGVVGRKITAIEHSGIYRLDQEADSYTINGTRFRYAGEYVTAGMFEGWKPIGAEFPGEMTVVWKQDGIDQYKIWKLSSNNDFVSEVSASSGSWALQRLEGGFVQDLNQDGQVGPAIATIETSGQTKLARVAGDAYGFTFSGNFYAALTKDSAQVVVGQTDGWTPIGAEITTSFDYKVVWKHSGVDEYKVWTVFSDGTYSSGDNVVVPGSSADIQVLELAFGQDLNGDGQIAQQTVIETSGTTKLAKVGNGYQLGLTGVNPTLNYGGSVIEEGQFAGWTPVAAETKSGGYYVVWKQADADQYKIWATNVRGDFTYDYGVMSGSDWMLRTLESTLKQDVNGDGAAGLPDSPFDITYFFSDPDFTYDLYIKTAAARWEQIITADLPSVNNATYGLIDDVRIDISVHTIDGVGGALAGGQPIYLRTGSNLTDYGTIDIDSADLANMRANGTLVDAVMHEMGHVLGIGSLWSLFGLASNGQYTGHYGLEAYRELSGDASATYVPLETSGGSGTANKHWSEAVFGNELMTSVATLLCATWVTASTTPRPPRTRCRPASRQPRRWRTKTKRLDRSGLPRRFVPPGAGHLI